MPQQLSPWLESAYGWNFGENNWNTGIDNNQLKFSFMFDRNVEGVVSSLPAAVNGQAYFLTTDNRIYFAVGTTWFSTPVPKWFEFVVRSTGDVYQFNGSAAVAVDSITDLDARLDAVEVTVASLGTAAFENVEFFATQAQLDVAEADAAAYTDNLRDDLSQISLWSQGAAVDGITDDTAAITSAISANVSVFSNYGTTKTTFNSTPTGLDGIGKIILSTPVRTEWINPASRLTSARISPPGFSYVPNYGIRCVAPGVAQHGIDLAKLFESNHSLFFGNSEYWVDPINGLDTNAGTVAAPFKTIKKAYQASGTGTIRLAAGTYTDAFFLEFSDNNVSAGTVARPIRIIGMGEVTIRAPGDQPSALTWVLSGSNYTATPSGSQTANAILWSRNGGVFRVPYKTDLTALGTVPNGWTQDAGTKLISIKLSGINVESIKSELEIMYSRPTNIGCRGTTTYIENVKFRGDNSFLASDDGSAHRTTVYMKNCSLSYMGGMNFTSNGARCFFQNVNSTEALNGDGFNYYDVGGPGVPGGVFSEALEIDCTATNNSTPIYNFDTGDPSSPSRIWDGNRNKQGSSGHDSSVICRINGVYSGNFGQNIADTGANSKTWMIGSQCLEVYAELAAGGTQGRYMGLWTEGAAYLDNVLSVGTTLSYGFYNQSGTSKHLNCQYRGFTANMALVAGVIDALNPSSP